MKSERLKRIAALVRDKHVLDIGCVDHRASKASGPDWLHRHIRDHAASVLGLDNELAAIEELSLAGYHVVYGDAERFTLDRTFDVIVAAELIEHLNNPGLFLACAWRHLKDGGQLVLTTPNAFYPKRQFEILIHGHPAIHSEHTMWFCPQTLATILSNAGFHSIIVTPLNNNDAYLGIGKIPTMLRTWLSTNLFAIAHR